MEQGREQLRQIANDLAWVVSSPSLVSRQVLDSKAASIDDIGLRPVEFVLDDEAHLTKLSGVAEYTQHRVGRYFEGLVAHWLETICEFTLVARNLQIKEANRTIGEIDFLFRDHQERLHHWEIAVKFYLYYANENFPSNFLGPNAADNFEKKAERVFSHQLPLSLGRFPEVEFRRAFVKGAIFYHPLGIPPTTTPDLLAENHLRGTWVRESELELLTNDADAPRFQLMSKPEWLSMPDAEQHSLNFDQLQRKLFDHFTHRPSPIMLSSLLDENQEKPQTKRCIVVSDSWPNPNGR